MGLPMMPRPMKPTVGLLIEDSPFLIRDATLRQETQVDHLLRHNAFCFGIFLNELIDGQMEVMKGTIWFGLVNSALAGASIAF